MRVALRLKISSVFLVPSAGDAFTREQAGTGNDRFNADAIYAAKPEEADERGR